MLVTFTPIKTRHRARGISRSVPVFFIRFPCPLSVVRRFSSLCGDSERFAPHVVYYTRDLRNIFFCCLYLYTQMLDRRWDKVAERDFPKCQVFLNLALLAVVHLRKLFSQVYTKQCQIPSGVTAVSTQLLSASPYIMTDGLCSPSATAAKRRWWCNERLQMKSRL